MSEQPLPKAAEVYRRLSVGLGPALADAGLGQISRVSYPCWRGPTTPSDEVVFVSAQVDRKARDLFAGCGFRLECEASDSPTPAQGLTGRAMFFQLLTGAELDRLLDHQNAVIRSLPAPSAQHVELYPAGGVRERYLSYFQPQTRFDAIDCWLRFRDLDDVDGWAATLGPLVPIMASRAAAFMRSDTLHLGRGSLLPRD